MKKTIQTVSIHEATTHLSELVDRASRGESFIIAKAGKPLVKVVPLDAPTPKKVQRLGFLSGQMAIPEDFDTIGNTEIMQIFENMG